MILGFEAMAHMGERYYVRLKWDTAPPFLMAVEAAANGLLEANLEGGVTLTYDLAYPIRERVWIGASLSYAARRVPGAAGRRVLRVDRSLGRSAGGGALLLPQRLDERGAHGGHLRIAGLELDHALVEVERGPVHVAQEVGAQLDV